MERNSQAVFKIYLLQAGLKNPALENPHYFKEQELLINSA
jgi:hypothetical protein